MSNHSKRSVTLNVIGFPEQSPSKKSKIGNKTKVEITKSMMDQWLIALQDADDLAMMEECMKKSNDPNIRRLIGVDGPKGKGLGLNDDWSYQVIKQVGNYGESFERTVGMSSPLEIKRGANALWNDGGFLYAPPMR